MTSVAQDCQLTSTECTATARFRIGSNAGLGQGNPYIELFYGALGRHGIDFAGTLEPNMAWLRQHAEQVEAVHIHWPEHLLRRKPQWVRTAPGIRASWRLQRLIARFAPPFHLVRFSRFLRVAKGTGKRIIWTLHNLEPHERRSAIQRAGFRALARHADLIICHDQSARAECRKRYKTGAEVVVMAHGNYDGVYPAPRPPSTVRRELGFEERGPLVGCLGAIRHYKGFDLAIDAVASLRGEVQLLVAGCPIRCDSGALRGRASQCDFVRVVPRRLTDQEFADFAHAADAILLPYRGVTGSGALLAAATFGRGVVASDLPFFRDVLREHPDAGAFFPPGNVPALADAIGRYLSIPAATRQRAARALADQYSWDRVIQSVVEVIERWRGEAAGYSA